MACAVLIVDDSPISRKLVIKSLPAGWTDDVTEAANGLEALAALRARPRTVVLLDLNMPVMDGYQFLEALDPSSRPPVVVLSGDIQPKALDRVMALGARAFLKKPVRAEALAEVLGTCGLL
jgi:two-component system, chemotaxis family, chemotaxis protein CheY